LWIDVDFGAGAETDVYAHINVELPGSGNPIAPGERIGTVRDDFFNAIRRPTMSIGVMVIEQSDPYTIHGDRDPNDIPPIVTDMDGDGHDFIVVNAAANDHSNPRQPAWGDVDFLADVSDDMSPSINISVSHSSWY